MTEEMFDEWLDDVYPTYAIAGITLYPSQILKTCDPIAYRIALSEIDFDEEEEDEDVYLAS
jgi:hypothetical protein